MTTQPQSPARARPLEGVKAETIRRAGKLNPLDGINPEDGVTVANALTSLDRDEWAGEWSKLGTRADPFLHYLLEEFARQAASRYEGGERGVQLLYRSWVASGLAQQPYLARIALWVSADPEYVPVVQLGSAPMPRMVDLGDLDDLLQAAGNEPRPRIMEFTDQADLSRLLTVPLDTSLMVTVMIPPRRTLERTSAIAPFLGVITPTNTRLNLVEASGPAPPEDVITWQPGEEGWRSEAYVKYPNGWYHAHLAVALPPPGVRWTAGSAPGGAGRLRQ